VWHQIALSKSGTNVATYADGALLASGSTRPGQDVASHKLFIGSNGNSLDHSGEPFQGLISDVRVYEVALSAGEVAELYQFENGQAGPSPAAATAQVVNGFVVGATVTAGGSGYTNPPDVSILGGGGAGATAVAVISNGVVSAITIEATGSGYTSEPSIVIAPPPYPPIEATGVAEVINGFVAGVTITGDGYGYGTNVPPVSFLGGDGSDAAGFATVQNGYVTAVTMTSTGSNYLTAPLVLIAAPPGVPSLGISRVTSAPAATVKIDLTLIPGYTYEFQTSTDGLTWSINGSAFLATNSAMSQLFNISTNVQLFELKQVSNR
jgi:hypothetical protein